VESASMGECECVIERETVCFFACLSGCPSIPITVEKYEVRNIVFRA
jgi:hypothetical protein